MNNEPEKTIRPSWQIVILMVAASIAWGLILYCLAWTGIIDWIKKVWTMHWDLELLELLYRYGCRSIYHISDFIFLFKRLPEISNSRKHLL